jgi:DNA primase
MPQGEDPDSFLREKGPEAFLGLIESAQDYLSFCVKLFSQKMNLDSPAGKNELVQLLTKQIRNWEKPLMVHESLRKLAHLVQVPESILGVGQDYMPNIHIKKSGSIGLQTIDPDRIAESDFLRWLLLMGNQASVFVALAKLNIQISDLHVEICRKLYEAYLASYEEKQSYDLIDLTIRMDDADGQYLITEILQKKVNQERAEEHFIQSMQKILDRNWMEAREEIKSKIQSANCSDDEADELIKKFDELRRNSPQIIKVESGSSFA